MDHDCDIIEALRPFARLYKAALLPNGFMRRGYSLIYGTNTGAPSRAEVSEDDFKKACDVVTQWDIEHGLGPF